MIGSRRRRAQIPAAALLVALVAAACAEAGPTTAPAGSPGAVVPSATALASPTPSDAVATASPPPASPAPVATPSPTPTPAPGVVVAPPSPTATPQPRPRGGDGLFIASGRVRIPGTGVRVTLPADWWTLDIDGRDLEAIVDALPDRAARGLSDELIGLVADRLSLVAVDLQPADRGASATAFTLDLAVPGGPIGDVLLANGVDIALDAAGVRDATTGKLTIDGRSAIRADFRVKAGSGATRGAYRVTQLYLALEDEVLVLTVAIPGDGQAKDAERIIDSVDAS